jgi:hypothetical protein
MSRMRGGSGLGDAIYMRPLAEALVRAGEEVTVCSDYPDVFTGSGAQTEPFSRERITWLAHYTAGKANPKTNQWEDICASAGVAAPLSFEWTVRNTGLIEEVRSKAAGRPVVLVHGGRAPMARTDGFGKELLPRKAAMDAVLASFSDCCTVRIGKGVETYPIKTTIDLTDATTVTDLLDLGRACDAIVGQCSFIIPLAEVFDRRLLTVWAAHGMQGNMHPYVHQITPQKILSKESSMFVIDSWSDEQIRDEVRAFRFLR